MTKQIVNFVELKELYNIFLENKNNLSFELNNYLTNDDLLKDAENNKKKNKQFYFSCQIIKQIFIK